MFKRWLDRALSRWYVPRERYSRECESIKFWRRRYFRLRSLRIERGQIIITTDYNRGIPCS